jgi:hypothetical protein
MSYPPSDIARRRNLLIVKSDSFEFGFAKSLSPSSPATSQPLCTCEIQNPRCSNSCRVSSYPLRLPWPIWSSLYNAYPGLQIPESYPRREPEWRNPACPKRSTRAARLTDPVPQIRLFAGLVRVEAFHVGHPVMFVGYVILAHLHVVCTVYPSQTRRGQEDGDSQVRKMGFLYIIKSSVNRFYVKSIRHHAVQEHTFFHIDNRKLCVDITIRNGEVRSNGWPGLDVSMLSQNLWRFRGTSKCKECTLSNLHVSCKREIF